MCVCGGGGGGHGGELLPWAVLCFREMCVWIKKVGNMARVWDFEELGKRIKKTYVYFTL